MNLSKMQVNLSKMQLDEVEGESNNSPTRLIRNLISVFFPWAQLARSSAYGTRKKCCPTKGHSPCLYP